jgi:hypothetical protein
MISPEPSFRGKPWLQLISGLFCRHGRHLHWSAVQIDATAGFVERCNRPRGPGQPERHAKKC